MGAGVNSQMARRASGHGVTHIFKPPSIQVQKGSLLR